MQERGGGTADSAARAATLDLAGEELVHRMAAPGEGTGRESGCRSGTEHGAPARRGRSAPGELDDRWNVRPVSEKSGTPFRCPRRRTAEADALEVMSFGHHLRSPEEDRAVGLGEGGEPLRELSGVGGDVGTRRMSLSPGSPLGRSSCSSRSVRTEPCELRRPGAGQSVGLGSRRPQCGSGALRRAVQGEPDVAGRDSEASARTRGSGAPRDASTVEEEDRLPALVRYSSELLEERRRERRAGPASEIHDLDVREPPPRQPPSSSRSSRSQLSGRGVALPYTATAPSMAARFAVTVRASCGSDSCL